MSTEMTILRAYLTAQREHILGILADLDDEALRRPVLPSGWSCLGLVAHLTYDVERIWFTAVAGGDSSAIDLGVDGWQVPPDRSAEAVFAAYRRAIADADAVLASASPEQQPAWWPANRFGDWRLENIRDLVLHVITETACHAGHLDAARELIDGRRWLVLDGSGVPTDEAVAAG
ncbi:MAG TPA: DinB family protein [Micromonosporaceae bacterium]